MHRYKELVPEESEMQAIDELLNWLEQAVEIDNKRRGS